MNKHLQPLVHPHVKVDVAVGSTGISILQSAHIQSQRLLIQSTLVEVGWVDFLVDAGRNDIGHWLTHAIFLQVDRRQGKLCACRVIHLQFLESCETLFVSAPLPAHEFNAGKAKRHRLTPPLHKHPHESDGAKIADAIVSLLILPYRDLKLIPFDGSLFSSSIGFGYGFQHICQIALTHVLRR